MLALAPILADYAGTMEVSNRTEVRGRVTQTATANAPPLESLDLADIPTARLTFGDRTWKYTIGYSVIALVPDLELGFTPLVMQSADVGVAWHYRRVDLGLAEYGTYGQQNTAYSLLGTTPTTAPNGTAPPPTGVQVLAAPQTIRFGSSRTVLTGRYQLSPRWYSSTILEYAIQGGLDSASQGIMPVVHGPRAEVILGHDVTRIDIVETHVMGQHSDTSTAQCIPTITTITPGVLCAPTSDEVQATEVWRHRFTHDTEGSFGAGASFSHVSLGPGQRFGDRIYPVADAGLTHRRTIEQSHTLIRLEVAVAPILDLRSGVLDERAQATLRAEVPQYPMLYSAQVGVARSIDSPFIRPVTIAQASIEAERRLTPVVSVGGGLRYAWQQQDPFGAYSGAMIVGFVTLQAPVARF